MNRCTFSLLESENWHALEVLLGNFGEERNWVWKGSRKRLKLSLDIEFQFLDSLLKLLFQNKVSLVQLIGVVSILIDIENVINQLRLLFAVEEIQIELLFDLRHLLLECLGIGLLSKNDHDIV